MNSTTGKYLIVAGIVLVAVGIIVYFFSDKMNWIGRLPGDIRIERENFRVYFPFTSMVILSIVLTLVLQILKRV